MESRKQELLSELQEIKSKEIAIEVEKSTELAGGAENLIKLEEAKAKLYKEKQDAKVHTWVMGGDFLIKFLMALFIAVAFLYIVYTGNVEAMAGSKSLIGESSGNGNFQLLSVIGPLFGMVLSYYFGKSKASANGE